VYDLIDANPWALLVSNGDLGPLATNLPLVLDRARGAHGVLVGHLARANHHASVLRTADALTLAIFQGPFSYISPSWYPDRDMPGTYYYMAVHCYGSLRIQSEEELEASVTSLSDRMEAPIPDGWSTAEIPSTEITRRLPAILGFELVIDSIEGKFKLGQDEPKKDALAVAARLRESADRSHRALAEAVQRANSARRDIEEP
jgi:transcriptional regulator